MILSLVAVALSAAVANAGPIAENCDAPSTLWDKHYCEVIKNTAKYQPTCAPFRTFPGNATTYEELTEVKGFVMMYHGFTACPNHNAKA
jgi:hypothetical protein